ncbi:hypothetical protein D2908_09805 [Streptococcus sp. LQJ-218]|uniref:metalloprotease family protein n=1 Tax=Streptococcus sp. LQJ-218 TaxID=2283190 RepID=UPI000E3C03F1|nr:metalloprotease family protein [Streptococcus sp. LQJ-218]TAA65571.1 hypothetical protein D2908_09805 [Streptococcus sp. LQJ-218]
MTAWEIMVQLPLVLLTVVIHEMLHYLTAYFLGYNPKFEFENFLVPSVKFINKGRDVHNFIIALAAPTGLVLIGLLIPSNNAFLSLVRIVCFLNVLHIFPFCTDGQVILLSLLNIMRKGGKA